MTGTDLSLESESSSFRDPAGAVFRRDGVLYRQINLSFAERWQDLRQSGLLAELQSRGLLVQHEEVSSDFALDPRSAAATIRPELVPFISYPYEWTFGQLKDAALLTLEAQTIAASRGFSLRDATAFNVQFHRGKPILIDTLSFERADQHGPWNPYRQFCEQFLAPLALMAQRDPRCSLLLRDLPDGIPLDLAARLMPFRSRFSLSLGSHLHLHAHGQRGARTLAGKPSRPMSVVQRDALMDSLRRTIEGQNLPRGKTIWTEYGEGTTSYSAEAVDAKDRIVRGMLEEARPAVVWDVGANLGRYSRIAASTGARVVALEADAIAADGHYQQVRLDASDILPLVQDIANPSPAIGWASAERRSLLDRADADVVLALALVHHLAIGRNVPLPMIAALLARLAPQAIIEWVPRDDPMVRQMLVHREGVFPEYTFDGFRDAFGKYFEIAERAPITDSGRELWQFRRRSPST